jgi:hypothetical protein
MQIIETQHEPHAVLTEAAILWCLSCDGPTPHAYVDALVQRRGPDGYTVLIFACECGRRRTWGNWKGSPPDRGN